jgi:peptidoglycan/LPS O-acetylase OafA/YrhL
MTQKNHLENLTWLRGIAAFLVVVSHCIRTTEVKYAPIDEKSFLWPVNLLDLGSFGVCVFFALSGCTLYLSNKNTITLSSSFLGFYIKRFMRIWPAYALSMLIYLVFIEIFKAGYQGDKSFWIAHFLKDYSALNIFQYLTLTFNITGPRDLFASPYWSLPVEFQYYLILPFAIILMTSGIRRLIVPIAFGTALYFAYKNFSMHADRTEIFQLGYTFFGGVFLANYYQQSKFQFSAAFAISIFVLLVSALGLIENSILIIPPDTFFISDKWNFYGISAIACVGLALFSKPFVVPTFLRSFLNEYGDISYSIYLFHMLFIGVAAILVTRMGIYGNFRKLFFVLIFSLVFSFIFAKFTYRFIEIPSINLGKKWSKKSV